MTVSQGPPPAASVSWTVAAVFPDHSHGGDLRVLSYQQVSGGPYSVFDGGKGEPHFCKIIFRHVQVLAHPIQHQLGCEDLPCWKVREFQGAGCRPLVYGSAALPEQMPHRLGRATTRLGACGTLGHAALLDMPRECITDLTGRIS